SVGDPGSLSGLRRMTRPRPSAVHIRDYNWRAEANTSLVHGKAVIDEAGYGVHAYYGHHVPTDKAAELRAKVRAEELRAGKHVYSAHSVNQDFWPGQRVKLT